MFSLSVGFVKRLCNTPCALMILCAITIFSGCSSGIKMVRSEYISNFNATPLFGDSGHLITLNAFYDDRTINDKIGEGYSASGNKLEIWISENDPILVVENSIISQFKNSGFTVVQCKGWNFDPNSIPEQVKSRLIVGGKLKTFWVESRPSVWTVTINSKVSIDLFITDVLNKKNLYTGQFTGNSQSDHGYRDAASMQNSINFALSQAVNKVFQDQTVRDILLKYRQ